MKALSSARSEAGRLKHNFVGTEHLLLGLIEVGQGTGVNALLNLGVELESLRSDVESQIVPDSETRSSDVTPYTPQYSNAIDLAGKEAKALNHFYVGTEHLLLGLVRERDKVTATVFDARNLDIEKVRREVVNQINPNAESETTEYMNNIYARDLLHEFKQMRQDFDKKIKIVESLFDSLKTEITQLRTDMQKGNS
jgi:ATP-dependent Clp protease ATP-binding subunit ClpC